MTDATPLMINRNIPGLVAALTQGRGDDAAAMAHVAISETHPALLVFEVYQYLMNGWMHLAASHGVVLTADHVDAWFSSLAETTIAQNDLG